MDVKQRFDLKRYENYHPELPSSVLEKIHTSRFA